MTQIGIEVFLTETSFGRKSFGLYNKDREFYTFKGRYVPDFIRKSLEHGAVLAFIGHSESKHFDERLSTNKRLLKIKDNEISIIINNYLEYIAVKEKKYQTLFLVDESEYRETI